MAQFEHHHSRIFWTFAHEDEKTKNCLLSANHVIDVKSSAISITTKLSQLLCNYCYNVSTDPKDVNFGLTDAYQTKKGLVSHVYLRQEHLGKPILNSLFSAHFTSNMTLIAYSSTVFCYSFNVNYHFSIGSLLKCLEVLISFLQIPLFDIEHVQLPHASSNEYALFSSNAASFHHIPIKALASWFYHTPTKVLLPTWKFEIVIGDNLDIVVGIVTFHKGTGKPLILSVSSWAKSLFNPKKTNHFNDHYYAYNVDMKSKILSKEKKGSSRYLVYPIGIDSPADGAPINCTGPFSRFASPIGWNSISPLGHSTNSTMGNNVYAQENHSGGEFWLSNNRPISITSSFIYPISNWSDPHSYVNSSISNVFYWINLLHDILYNYGFDESAGNFQNMNFSRGGKGLDEVIADVQDGSGVFTS